MLLYQMEDGRLTLAAYTMATSTKFNGFGGEHPIIYINSESKTGGQAKMPFGSTEPFIQCEERLGQPVIVPCST